MIYMLRFLVFEQDVQKPSAAVYERSSGSRAGHSVKFYIGIFKNPYSEVPEQTVTTSTFPSGTLLQAGEFHASVTRRASSARHTVSPDTVESAHSAFLRVWQESKKTCSSAALRRR